MSEPLHVPQAACRTETEVKKSRFICQLIPCADKAQVKTHLAAIRTDLPDSNHHCWAYQIGPELAMLQGCSDDGEPHGTAGRPMLNVLSHAGITDVLAVVSRIFGGTKLGTGGLVRAYSQAVNLALEEVVTTPYMVWQSITMRLDYANENQVRHTLKQFNFQLDKCEHGEEVVITGRVAEEEVSILSNALQNLLLGFQILN